MNETLKRVTKNCWMTTAFMALATVAFPGPIDLTVGTAAQTSNYSATDYLASNGINGSTGDFTHTNGSSDTDPVWQVQLPSAEAMTTVILHNRGNCCQLRLADITVEILDFSGDVTQDFGDWDRVVGSGSPPSSNWRPDW